MCVGVKAVAAQSGGLVGVEYEDAIWKRGGGGLIGALAARGVERCVDLFDRARGAVGAVPRLSKQTVLGTAAFGARAMPCGASHGFIEEKEAGVAIGWGHAGRGTARFVAQRAGDPSFGLPAAADLAVEVVQAASVAHEAAALWEGGELAERIDPVRHHCRQAIISLVLLRWISG